MKTTARRCARLIHLWLKTPHARADVDLVMAELEGWHASTYPSVQGGPLEMAFFDHAKANAAIAAAMILPAIENVSVVHRFELEKSYRTSGMESGDSWVMRCVGRRGRFVEFVREDVHGNVAPGPRIKKQLRQHTQTNHLRGDYVELDKHRRVYAVDDATE